MSLLALLPKNVIVLDGMEDDPDKGLGILKQKMRELEMHKAYLERKNNAIGRIFGGNAWRVISDDFISNIYDVDFFFDVMREKLKTLIQEKETM